MALQLSECQRNPAYIQLGPSEDSQSALTSCSDSDNPIYHNIDANDYSQNPAYGIH